MKVLSKVLWAIDFKSNHKISTEKITRVRNQFGNDLVLLHVLPSHVGGAASQIKIIRSVEYEIRNKFAKRMGLDNDTSVKIRVEIGDVADQINKVAIEENVNLVVLNKGKSAKLGANGFKILRKLKKPVAILPNNPTGNKRHIVCSVDNSVASALALKSAIIHARKDNSKLSVISVYRPFNLTSPHVMRGGLSEEKEREHHYQTFKQELTVFLENFDFSGINAVAQILEGNPEEQIIKYARRASILYIGSSGKNALQRAVLGSVSEYATRNAECNVVLLKTEDVFKLNIPPGLKSVEVHFNRGNELVNLGFLREAILQYKKALKIKKWHLPSIEALARVYVKIGAKEEAQFYRNLRNTITNKMMNNRIEHEIRHAYRTVT
ncbi:universal stress protein [Prolixibacteraceae bacterium Z1-6]|uniref:Universal stress protein n=1 Tax=Draconibacterium aestuarii TaxID=2998507 RepID=A0A9X3F3N9_9BACT|nr:universal stress protein [Prolixibacteraceae bacterium Z1-6]